MNLWKIGTKTILFFCFFSGNAAGSGGRDVQIADNEHFSDAPFSGCYSTTAAGNKRCCQNTTDKDGWMGGCCVLIQSNSEWE
jgi:hypothetical protein